MERELPIINIEGTDFLVDVIKEELKEKANIQNVIGINKMYYVGDGYSFDYDPKSKNHFEHQFSKSFGDDRKYIKTKLPELVKLDPLAMSEKQNLTIEDIINKTDFEFMETKGSLDLRWNKGILPTLEIEGHIFYVDINMDKLRPKDDFQSKGIPLNKIREYYDRDLHAYLIPYNPKTHEFQEIDHFTITELPKEIVVVQFPHEHELDRMGWNKKHGFDIRRGVDASLQMNFKSRTLPWKETNIPNSIMLNRMEKGLPLNGKLENKQIQNSIPEAKKGRGI